MGPCPAPHPHAPSQRRGGSPMLTSLQARQGQQADSASLCPNSPLIPLFLFHPSATGSRSVVGKAVPGSPAQSPRRALGPTCRRATCQGLHIWEEGFPQPSGTCSPHREGGRHGRGWRQACTCLLHAGNPCARWEQKRDCQCWCKRRGAHFITCGHAQHSKKSQNKVKRSRG